MSNPSLSVIVIALGDHTLLERCLSSLDEQARREDVEIVAVVRRDAPMGRLEDIYRQVRWIEAPQHENVPRMRSLGIAACRGEILAFLEGDCIVGDDWCAALLVAHRRAAAAIGGPVHPGPYEHPLDWASYFSEYGRFMPPLPPGPALALPGTNVSYKKGALLAGLEISEGGLAQGLQDGFYEVFVHQRLLRAGLELLVEPSLVVYNVRPWKPAEIVASRYHHGRGYAGLRVAGLPGLSRLPYALLAIVLPVVLVGRIVRTVLGRRRYLAKLIQSLPWLVVLSSSWSLGELVGYVSGPGDSPSHWR